MWILCLGSPPPSASDLAAALAPTSTAKSLYGSPSLARARSSFPLSLPTVCMYTSQYSRFVSSIFPLPDPLILSFIETDSPSTPPSPVALLCPCDAPSLPPNIPRSFLPFYFYFICFLTLPPSTDSCHRVAINS
jgi:hypothetical protein